MSDNLASNYSIIVASGNASYTNLADVVVSVPAFEMPTNGRGLTVTGGSVALVNNFDGNLYITVDSWAAGEVGVLSPGNAVVFPADFVFDVTGIDPNGGSSEVAAAAHGEYSVVESSYNRSVSGVNVVVNGDGASWTADGGDTLISPAYSVNSITGSRTVESGGQAIVNDGTESVTIQIDGENILIFAGQLIILAGGVVFTVLSNFNPNAQPE
jgi:hypothetical protein